MKRLLRPRRPQGSRRGLGLLLAALALQADARAQDVAVASSVAAGAAADGAAPAAPDPSPAAAAAAGADADQAFESGVELTRAGRFEDALPQFLAAAHAGDDSGRLHFNLGVVHYRLRRYDQARAAFERAAGDPETADLAIYNLGLVALAQGSREQAAVHFRRTREQAASPDLRALAERALARATAAPERAGRGSLTMLRVHDSNVAIPLGARGEIPSEREDDFWEARAGWAGALGESPAKLGYRASALATRHDRIDAADLDYAEGAIEWRGPFGVELGGSLLAVGDRAYQRTGDLRLRHLAHDGGRFRVMFEAAGSRVSSLRDATAGLDGTRAVLGLQLETWRGPGSATLGLRRVLNDRRSAALSPEQTATVLRLRWREPAWSSGAWARYTRSDYRTLREDETAEFGADIGLRLLDHCEVLLELTRLDQRSSVEGLSYQSTRLYTGLRLRF